MIDVTPCSYSVSMSRSKLGRTTVTPGESAAIYCRISHTRDEDQTGVDRQERICRDIAERLQLRVEPAHVYVDNNRSAWQRNRKRPGWEEMLEAMGEGKIRHVIVYHPDRLMRQPKDLEELLSIADDKRVLLHGEANRRDLSDPDDRFILRIEVAHACRSSDDTSRRLKDALKDKAREGKPHVGNRPYGYTSDGCAILEEEAEIVREVFRRYLDGESPRHIAQDLMHAQSSPPRARRGSPRTFVICCRPTSWPESGSTRAKRWESGRGPPSSTGASGARSSGSGSTGPSAPGTSRSGRPATTSCAESRPALAGCAWPVRTAGTPTTAAPEPTKPASRNAIAPSLPDTSKTLHETWRSRS
ncbi:recombinase family protein [Streptomyces sp. NPDC057611]|uniref:recombinase family protein n=1 Tax=Streptomyces sp. NPDC057611 TaxID=3346182 RepID=UPI00367F98E3